MLSWLRKAFGWGPPPARRPAARRQPVRQPAASYDAAGDGDDNKRHWANADGLSANTANSLGVRQRLRQRSRYEFDNNSYARGLTLTLANDLVGTGPVLHVTTEDEVVNDGVMARWREWCQAVGFGDKLHTLKQAKTRDGEGFARFITNPRLKTAVKLDLDVFECDQCTTHALNVLVLPSNFQAGIVDGIELDEALNPTSYYVLRQHPGDTSTWGGYYEKIPAEEVVHWFRKDRPRQFRGVPELTSSLNLFAQLRRYTLATLSAAETAANFSALLETAAGPDTESAPPDPFDALEIERNMMVALPAGAKLAQLRAEQPTTTYATFKQELLKEIGRAVNAPYNVAAGDSAPYNYSSGRLDHLLYRSSMRVEREQCVRVVLDPTFEAWLREARLIPGYLPAGTPDVLDHSWYWPGGVHSIDPQKEAQADELALASGTTTLAELLAEYGQDWRAFLQQRAREMELMESLGLPLPAWLGGTPGVPVDTMPPDDGQGDDPEDDGGDDGDGGDGDGQPTGPGSTFGRNCRLNGSGGKH